jgi:glycerate 2-kinase
MRATMRKSLVPSSSSSPLSSAAGVRLRRLGINSLTLRCMFALTQTASVCMCSAFGVGSRSLQRQQHSFHSSLSFLNPSISSSSASSSSLSSEQDPLFPSAGAPFIARRGVTGAASASQNTDARQTPEETKMTSDARSIVDAAIHAVEPVFSVQQRLHHLDTSRFMLGVSGKNEDGKVYDLKDYDKVVLVAFGKASSAMASAVVDRLLESSYSPQLSGLVIIKDDHATKDETNKLEKHGISVLSAAHPVPDERSVQASRQLLELVRTSASPRTLVIACISGGGSALFCAPHPSLSLADLQATSTALLQSGWSIQDMNVVRKRLEQGKGGRLAQAAFPGHVMSLILSDVLGDPLDLIASGPTVPDTSSWEDAWQLVQRLPENALPVAVYQLLQAGVESKIPDSPSADDPGFSNCTNCLVGNNAVAVTAAAKKAQELGYHPVVLGTQLEGEASQVARVYIGLAQHLQQQATDTRTGDNNMYAMAKLPAALIAGGETTVSIPKDSTGKGGRNQELALAAAVAMKTSKLRQVVLASVGTDGTDGPTDAAGAVVDGGTVDRLTGSASEALNRHDAYPYLAQTDADGWSPLVKTGPTGTNVADVCVILIEE